jgi:Xaa-Pro dipeptidase
MTPTQQPPAHLLERAPGALPLEEGGRVDFGRLRAERLERCRAEMSRDGLDALILADEANARYVSGARRLWLGATKPFVPGCVVLPDGELHLMSTWEDGIPLEIPRDHLFAASWNPERYGQALADIERLRSARQIGVDAMTPTMASLIASVLPQAQLRDGAPTMRRARRVKTADEIACIRTAIAAAESGLSKVIDALEPGRSERELFGQFTERLGALGLTIAATQCTFFVTSAGLAPPTTPRRAGTNRRIDPGDLVVLDAGALFAGYEGSLARTWMCPGGSEDTVAAADRLADRAQMVMDALIAATRPGATGQDVLRAYEATGEPVPQLPIVRGVGLGMEAPMVGPSIADDAGADSTLEEGMVLGLQAYVHDEARGGHLRRETVVVTDQGAALLTTLGAG